MSIDFNATTSKLENTTATVLGSATTSTICCWALADGIGESAGFNSLNGTLIAMAEGETRPGLFHKNAANVLCLCQTFTTLDGVWDFPATDGQWNGVAIAYDRALAANVPTARVNFASATCTERINSTGTTFVPSTGYSVGAMSSGVGTWDGAIAYMQVFNVILTANEMDMALRRPGSVTRGRVLWLPMYHATYLNDLSGSASNGTASNLGTRDGPPCQPLFAGEYGWNDYLTVAPGAAPADFFRRRIAA